MTSSRLSTWIMYWTWMQAEAHTTVSASEVCLACFEVCGRDYALDVTMVREIVRSREITPLPSAPALIEGVAELRGGIVPVLDLGRVLGNENSAVTNRSRIVVLECNGMVLGLLVDAATEVLSVDPAMLEDVPELATQTGYDVVCGVVRRPGVPPVMVLSVETILESVYRSASPNSGGD